MPGLANDLNISEPGYVSHNGAGVFHGRTFQAGTGITLTNADGIAGNTTIASTASLTDLHTARFIVASSTAGTGANYTSITAAIAAAVGTGINSTVFLQPGTYTENFNWPAGINLCAYECDAFTPNVTIVGNITATGAGSRTISGIRLQTNSAALLTVSANAAIMVNLRDCYLNCTNNTGITFSSASSSALIQITNCSSDLGTTGIGLFANSSAGAMRIMNLFGSNSGSSLTASTVSAGSCDIRDSFMPFPIAVSSTGAISIHRSHMDLAVLNTTALALTGTGSSGTSLSLFSSGTASAITVGAGTSLAVSGIDATSSNASVISGAGTITYGIINSAAASNNVSVTTQNPTVLRYGVSLSSLQPAFGAFLGSTVNNVTGNGAVYQLGTTALTEIYDQGNNFNTNGTFTAPYTGKYHLNAGALVTGATVATNNNFSIVTSNRTYLAQRSQVAGPQGPAAYLSVLADMDAADTAVVTVSVTGEAGNTDDILGDASVNYTFFNGCLAN